ncbi:MAG: glycoside hydrolase family 18 protein, partial [Chloroflexi bacterium]
FTTFMTKLSAAVHTESSGWQVSVDTYSGSASWDGGIFKVGDLAPVVDAFFIMAYDMASGNNSQQAGPNAPLNGWTYNDTNSVQQYLTKAPASKVILGVPYYGRKWSTRGTAPNDFVTSGSQADTYDSILSELSCAQQLRHSWDPVGQVPWMSWWSPQTNDPCGGNYGSWRELYYDDPTSLGLKYDLVNASNLRGTGIWALGYDGASKDLWRILSARFTGGSTQFYFAEGFTGGGFTETLSLLMPNQGGVATIDYYLTDRTLTQSATLTAGKVTTVDVNAAVGANKEVSARVTLPGPGMAQRDIHFNTNWVGSTRVVGVTSPATEWNFAEGSTDPAFSEFLTLQNPNPTPTAVELDYFTDRGDHPVKTLTVPANSRATVIVFLGDLSNKTNCIPSAAGANCGVGRGLLGVSVRVKSALPIVAERPFYVNGHDFGAGPIRDGHDAFGATAAATQWNFAEGTTLPGFYEYLTLQNPGSTAASVQLTYVDFVGRATVKSLTVDAHSRSTVLVFDSTNGVGRNVQGVSVQVNSNQPILAERPMYMVWNFGTGTVAGANVIVGARTFGQLVEFPAASTLNGDNAYLTVQNAGGVPAHVTATYYAASGPIVKTLVVPAGTRHTILVFNATEGAGPGYGPLPILVDSDQPVLIESPSYSSNPSTYGAVDTVGYPAVRS